MSQSKTFLSIQNCLIVAGTAGLLLVQMPQFCDDPGVGWHLRTGAYVLNEGKVPRFDPFLAHDAPRKWVSDQWLSDAALYWLYSLGSWPALYAALAALYCVTYFLLLYPAAARLSGFYIPVSLSLLITFKIGQIHFILRPVMISFMFFSITYPVLLEYCHRARRAWQDHGKGAPLAGKQLLLPVLFVVWCNMHPGFVLGLFTACLMSAALALEWLMNFTLAGRKYGLRSVLNALLLCAACAAVTLLNPYGFELHSSIFSLSASDYFMELHDEWQAPDYGGFEGQLFLAPLVILIVSGLLAGFPRWGVFEPLLVCCFAYFSSQAVRMLPFFGIVVLIPVAETVCRLGRLRVLSDSGTGRSLLRMLANLEKRESTALMGVPAALAVTGMIIIFTAVTGRLPLYTGNLGPPRSKYPYEAVSYLLQNTEGSSRAVIVAQPEWGGFITLFGENRLQPIIDDRNSMLGEDFYKEFYSALRLDGAWPQYLKERRATHLLLWRDSALAQDIAAKGALPLLFEDKISRLFAVTPLDFIARSS